MNILGKFFVPVVSAAWRLLWAGDESDSKLWVITWSEWGLCSRVIQLTASSRLRSDCAAPGVHGGPRLWGTHCAMPPGPQLCPPAGAPVSFLVRDWTRYPDPRIRELYPHTQQGGIFKRARWRLKEWWKVIWLWKCIAWASLVQDLLIKKHLKLKTTWLEVKIFQRKIQILSLGYQIFYLVLICLLSPKYYWLVP